MSEQVKSDSEMKKEDWMNSKWRPAMGWLYMGICLFDMVIFPILWSTLQTVTSTPITQWNPLTLQGAGLFHIAMGAVLGLAAFGRTQEKLAGANNGGMQPVAQSVTTTFGTSQSGFGAAPAFGATTSSSFGNNVSAGFGAASSSPSWGTTPVASGQVLAGFGGKPAPAQPQQPEL